MRRIFKIPVYAIGLVLLILAVTAYVYYFTTLPESQLNIWINRLIPHSGELNVRIERVNRDIWNHLVLEDVYIEPQAGSVAPMVRISKLDLDYKFWSLIKERTKFEYLYIDSITVIMSASKNKESTEPGEKRKVIFPFSASVKRVMVNSIGLQISPGDNIELDSLVFSAAAGDDRMELTLENLSGRWPAKDFELLSVKAGLSSDNGGILIDSLSIVTGRSRIDITGKTGLYLFRDMDLAVVCDPIDLNDIKNLTGVKVKGLLDTRGSIQGSIDRIEGHAVIDGIFMDRPFDNVDVSFMLAEKKLDIRSIKGNAFHALFDGSGGIDFGSRPETYTYSGKVRSLNLKNVAPDLATDFSGHLNLRGQGLASNSFVMQVDCDIDSARIEDYFFDKVRGPARFDLEKIDFLSGFSARYKHTNIQAAGRLVYKGDIDVTGRVSFSDLTDFTDQIFLKQLGGRGSAGVDVTGPTNDFAVSAYFDSDSCWTYGLTPSSIHIYADLKSFISHRVGAVSGYWLGGDLYSVPTDSGHFETSVSGDRVFLDSVFIRGLEGGIWFNGDYDGTQIPPVFRADTLWADIYGNRLFSKSPIVLSIYEDRTGFSQFNLGYKDGILNLDGSVSNDLDLNLNLEAAGFQIRPILQQVYPQKTVDGIWSGRAALTGNFQNPIIDIGVAVDSLTVDDVFLGKLEAGAMYSDGYLDTKNGKLQSRYGSFEFSGRLPLNLAFEEVENRLPEKPIDITLSTSGSRLLLSEAFIPIVESFVTDFKFDINLGGTYSKPVISGKGNLVKGTLDVLDLENQLVNVRAYLRMENETIFVDSAKASVSKPEKEWTKAITAILATKDKKQNEPRIAASGTIKLVGLGDFLYDLDVSGENVYFVSDQFDITGIANFKLKVVGQTPPTIKGEINILRLDNREEFTSFIDPEFDPTDAALEDSSYWNLDLDLNAVNNVWIKNSEVDAEFKADMHAERNAGIWGVLGTLDVIRGSYNLIGQKFKVISGNMTYKDVTSVDPEIDFVVNTRIRDAGGGTPSFTVVELRITGTLLEPKINTGPNSALSNEDVLRLLLRGSWAGGTISGGGPQSVIGGASALISSMGLDPLTTQGILQEFEIGNVGNGEEKDAFSISLAKYLSRNLYVRYSRQISGENPESSFGVEYYFNDNIFFQATQGTKGPNNEGISFDVNFNFEY